MIVLGGRVFQPIKPLGDLRVSNLAELPFEGEVLGEVACIVGDRSRACAFGLIGQEELHGLLVSERLRAQTPKCELGEQALRFVARVAKRNDWVLANRDAAVGTGFAAKGRRGRLLATSQLPAHQRTNSGQLSIGRKLSRLQFRFSLIALIFLILVGWPKDAHSQVVGYQLDATADGGHRWEFSEGYSGTYGILGITDVTTSATRIAIGSTGNVGIGTSAPSRTLHVYGANAAIAIQDSSSGGHQYVLTNYNTGDGSLGLYDATNTAMRWLVNSSGNVGIGTTNPGGKLTIQQTANSQGAYPGLAIYNLGNTGTGQIMVGSDNNVYFFNGISGYCLLTSGSSFTCPSDARLKKDVKSLPDEKGLAAIERLRPVSFSMIKDPSHAVQLGFIAQEVQKVLPEVVTRSSIKNDLTPDGGLTLASNGLMPVLTKAIQELKTLFDADHGDIARLKADNDNLRAELKASEAANDNEAAQIKAMTARLDALEATRH